jgi:hypothetical protein
MQQTPHLTQLTEGRANHACMSCYRGDDAEARAKELCQALGCTPEKATKALKKAPSLITLPPGVIQQRTNSLLELVGSAPDVLYKALLREPYMLSSQPETLRARFAQLAALPGADMQLMATFVRYSLLVLRRYVGTYLHTAVMHPHDGLMMMRTCCPLPVWRLDH